MSDTRHPRVTFGVIVLNGEPFTRYCLRSLYPFAHQIVVVEGASPGAAGVARADGHSSDGTLEVLSSFKSKEDPEGKLIIVTAEDEGHPDGFWPGEKDEQSRAYARRATGDYLWQVDIDEFYRAGDMLIMLDRLAADPVIDMVSFKMLTFWGSLELVVDGWYLRRGADSRPRLFRWGEGYTYATHRPPTVCDHLGRDLRTLRSMEARDSSRLGVVAYHYSLLFPHQVAEKGEYNKHSPHASRRSAGWDEWMTSSYVTLARPYRVHNVYRYPSWLRRFKGDHPEEALRMMADIRAGRTETVLRGTEDADRLLSTKWYAAGSAALVGLDYVDRFLHGARHPRSSSKRVVKRMLRGHRA